MRANLFRPHQHVLNSTGFIISILLLSLFIPRYNAKNDTKLYKACKKTITSACDKPISEGIGFPFWGHGIRHKDCGLEEFELICNGNDLVVDMGPNNKYQVLDINLSREVLTLNRNYNPLDYICESSSSSSSIPATILKEKLYSYSPETEDLHLFYHCNFETEKPLINSKFTCPNEDEDVVYYFEENSKPPALYFSSCSSYTILPVYRTLLAEFKMNSKSARELFGSSIEVHYNIATYQEACADCSNVGGLCWMGTYPDTSSINIDTCLFPGNKKSSGLKIGIASGVGGGIILLLLAIFLFYRRRKAKQGSYIVSRNISSSSFSMSDSEKGSGTYMGVPTFSYNELEKATNNFDSNNELGDGGFGTVYKGKLQDGREVAVKRLYENSMKRVEQFMNEIKILTQLRHPNLVVLYGSTSQQCRKLLLVYEYIPNGTIADQNTSYTILLTQYFQFIGLCLRSSK